jgi:WD40 repeat protein
VVEFLPGGKLFLGGAWDGPGKRRHFLHDLAGGAEVELPLGDAIWQGCWCVPAPDGQRLLAIHEGLGSAPSVVSLRRIDSPSVPVWSARGPLPRSAPVFLLGGSRFVLFQKARFVVWGTAGGVQADVPLRRDYQHPVASWDGGMFAARRGSQAAVFRAEDVRAAPIVLQNESRQEITGLAFHPSGRYLAASSNDGMVKVYDTDTWTSHAFHWEVGRMRSVAFSPDGMLAAAGTDKGRIILWDFDL